MPFCQAVHQLPVKGLHKAPVCQGAGASLRLQLLPDVLCGADHASHGQKGDPLLLVEHFPLAVDNGFPEIPQAPVRRAPGIADGQGAVVVHGKFQHGAQLPQVLGRHDAHVGDGGQKGVVENSLMGLPVAAHQPCPVHGEHHRQVLDTDIV